MTLDQICQMTLKPSTLNALHACRGDHPLGINNPVKWVNALAMATQDRAVNSSAVRWLQKKAAEEANMNVDFSKIQL